MNNNFLLIFDLDGTICDSIQDIKLTINSIFKKHKLINFTTDEVRTMIGSGFHILIEKALKKNKIFNSNIIQNIMTEFENEYLKNLVNQTKPFNGIIEILEYLKNIKQKKTFLKTIILTNKQENATKIILNKLNLSKYFDFIAGDRTFSEKKPNPLPIFEIAKKFKTKLENIFLIGDGINDILVAKNSGIKIIWTSYGYTTLKEIKNFDNINNFKINYKINNTAELKDIIFNIINKI